MPGPFLNPRAPIAIHERNLPHWQQPGALVFITWRLADSLPADLLKSWQEEHTAWQARHPAPLDAADDLEYRRHFPGRLERWLDAGHGSCVLRESDCSAQLEAALRHFDSQRYSLDSYIIMPNHVHLIVRLVEGYPLPFIVKSWKTFSARKINLQLGTEGALWQEGYWDRMVRDASHLHRCRDYIRRNPEKAKLALGAYRLHLSATDY